MKSRCNEATSYLMDRPSTQKKTLYVMQNEHGFVKVGRSLNPEIRRKNLERSEDCRIRIVATFPNQGHREESIHIALAEHRVEGEWFDGSPAALAAITRAIDPGASFKWPFILAGQSAEKWLDRFFDRRDELAFRRQYSRILTMLEHERCSGHDANCFIWFLITMALCGERGSVFPRREKGEWVWYATFPDEDEPLDLIPYDEDLESCLDLWPDDARPEAWDGSPKSCAIAAFKEWKGRF